MTRFVPVVLFTVLLLAFGGITAACDGDGGGSLGGGDTLTLEEYFQTVDELMKESEERGDQVSNDADVEMESAESLEDISKVFNDMIDEFVGVAKDLKSDLDQIEPPSEVATLHNELTATFDVAISALENIGNDLAGADPSELEGLAGEIETEFTALGSQSDTICFQMQDIADENEIAVDLECGD